MKSTLSRRGQTVIPARLRRRYGMVEGTRLEWLDTGAGLKVVPIPDDPIAALRGIARGERLTERLLAERTRDRGRE